MGCTGTDEINSPRKARNGVIQRLRESLTSRLPPLEAPRHEAAEGTIASIAYGVDGYTGSGEYVALLSDGTYIRGTTSGGVYAADFLVEICDLKAAEKYGERIRVHGTRNGNFLDVALLEYNIDAGEKKA